MKIINPHFEIILAAIIWGSSGIFIKYLNFPVTTISFFRLAVPAFILFIYFKAKKFKLFKRNKKLMLSVSFLSALRQFFYMVGFTFTSVGNAIMLHYTYPIFTAILGSVALKERISKRKAALIFISFVGMSLVFLSKGISFSNKSYIGMVAVITASIIYSLTLIIFKKESENHSNYEKVFYQNALGAIIFLPFIFFYPFPKISLVAVGILQAVLIGLVGFMLFFSGLKKVSASTASFLCYVEIVSAIFLAFIFLGELPTWNVFIGGSLIIFSTLLLINTEDKSKKA